MSYQVKISGRYLTQLEAFLDWHLEAFGSDRTNRATQKIQERLQEIAAMPTRFRKLNPESTRQLRLAQSYYHYVLYEVFDEQQVVQILAFRHERSDPAKLASDAEE